MAKDISAGGAKIVFSNLGGSSAGLTISEFSDEGTPFDCPDVDVSTNAKNLNGEMISSRTPSVIPFSVTVIPGSIADIRLREAVARSLIRPSNNTPNDVEYINTVTITMPLVTTRGGSAVAGSNTVTFSNVRIKSGPTGPSTSSEGRMSARTYSFEAEDFKYN